LYAIFPKVAKHTTARKYTAKDWDAQRPETVRLYENGTLESVIIYMREQYGLDATYGASPFSGIYCGSMVTPAGTPDFGAIVLSVPMPLLYFR
jgi:hypothetical protein